MQILYAVACDAAAYVIAGPARGITLPILAVILMFGIFGLSRRQMLAVLVYGLVVFGGAGILVGLRGEPRPTSALGLAYLIMIAVVLVSSFFLTARIQATHDRLRSQKREFAQALGQIRELAIHDGLTGLLNRRHMMEMLHVEQRRCERQGRSMQLALLDLDHFKIINDTHGHSAGDKALQVFADTLRSVTRSSDVLARWGGEEFALMLSDTPLTSALLLLERVRTAVDQLRIPHGVHELRLTVSIGLAEHIPQKTLEHTIERADRALYAAKAQGRNCVVEELAMGHSRSGDLLDERQPVPPTPSA